MKSTVNINVDQNNTKFNYTVPTFPLSSSKHPILISDKPSQIHAKIYYSTSNELGIKIRYPLDLIESLTITYTSKQNPIRNEFQISPPVSNIHLTNLSCGNSYEIIIYANNQVGFSLNEYLIGKTDGLGKASLLKLKIPFPHI